METDSGQVVKLEARLKDREELEDRWKSSIRGLEAQLKSYQKSVRKIQPKYMEALRDRGVFEAKHDDAVKAANAAKAELESSKAKAAKLKEEKGAVEQKLKEANAALMASEIPEVARLAKMEDDLRLGQEKADKLASKVSSQRQEMEFFQKAYQDASQEVTNLRGETAEQQRRITVLERKASDNLVEVHRINREGQLAAMHQLLMEARTTVQDRERELERAREEARSARNGRRETRQQSVPRSPRLGGGGGGVMSPRHPPRGPGSRGTSPGASTAYDGAAGSNPHPFPGMGYIHPQSGGRYAHLRD